MAIPKKVVERIQSRIKTFQSVLQAQKARDISEADTVTVVKDILSEVFGYDKYAELTGEHAIRATPFGYLWQGPASQTVDDEELPRLLAAAAERSLRRALDEDA